MEYGLRITWTLTQIDMRGTTNTIKSLDSAYTAGKMALFMKENFWMTSNTVKELSATMMVEMLGCNGSREKLFLVKAKSPIALEWNGEVVELALIRTQRKELLSVGSWAVRLNLSQCELPWVCRGCDNIGWELYLIESIKVGWMAGDYVLYGVNIGLQQIWSLLAANRWGDIYRYPLRNADLLALRTSWFAGCHKRIWKRAAGVGFPWRFFSALMINSTSFNYPIMPYQKKLSLISKLATADDIEGALSPRNNCMIVCFVVVFAPHLEVLEAKPKVSGLASNRVKST